MSKQMSKKVTCISKETCFIPKEAYTPVRLEGAVRVLSCPAASIEEPPDPLTSCPPPEHAARPADALEQRPVSEETYDMSKRDASHVREKKNASIPED
jgi:hypothetical protein